MTGQDVEALYDAALRKLAEPAPPKLDGQVDAFPLLEVTQTDRAEASLFADVDVFGSADA